jgi:hypothetical protein
VRCEAKRSEDQVVLISLRAPPCETILAKSIHRGSWRARTWRRASSGWCKATTTRGYSRQCCARKTRVGWLGRPALTLAVKTRYRQADAPCASEVDTAGNGNGNGNGSGGGSHVTLRFAQPQYAVTPGQCAVLYDGEVCLGCSVITTHASSSV